LTQLSVSGQWIYPLKSCHSIPLQTGQIAERGFAWDRRWMLINERGTYLNQIWLPRLACVIPHLTDTGVAVQAPGMEPLIIPIESETVQVLTVKVGTKVCGAMVVSQHTSEWFSEFLHFPCRLVYMPETTRRPVNPAYARNQEIVSFANGYPFHLLSQASLDALNTRLASPLPMNRFRPNIVVAGAEPFAEDQWHTLRINGHLFHLVKPCDRCAVTLVDQDTGERGRKEPLKTLASFRRVDKHVFFGRYGLSSSHGGAIHVGDPVEVLD